jgi:MAF protein
MPVPIILASASRYRQQLLLRLLDDFEVCDADIDESRQPGEQAEALVTRLALSKVRQLASRFKEGLIIGSDQVACLAGDLLTKPGNFANAKQQLRRCSGQKVVFKTGLCLFDAVSGDYDLVCESFLVHFRQLTDAEITAYLRREQPYDCAGSFKVEGLGICLFRALEGSDPNTLIGLPLIRLAELLRKRGVNPLLLGQ